MHRLALLLALGLSTVPARGQVAPDLARFVYPLAPPKASPKFELDVSDFPQSKAWGQTAIVVMDKWFGTITALLATQDWKPPKTIKLVIKKEISAPAWAAGNTITVSGNWITEHPEDLGVVIHELTHVVQSYPGSKTTPGWLVEGVADFVRWFRYEPGARPVRVNYETSKHTDSYGTTAYFLNWLTHHHNAQIVPALDAAMRKGTDPLPAFIALTGKNVDELWHAFIASKP